MSQEFVGLLLEFHEVGLIPGRVVSAEKAGEFPRPFDGRDVSWLEGRAGRALQEGVGDGVGKAENCGGCLAQGVFASASLGLAASLLYALDVSESALSNGECNALFNGRRDVRVCLPQFPRRPLPWRVKKVESTNRVALRVATALDLVHEVNKAPAGRDLLVDGVLLPALRFCEAEESLLAFCK